jgi:hypothetical protein
VNPRATWTILKSGAAFPEVEPLAISETELSEFDLELRSRGEEQDNRQTMIKGHRQTRVIIPKDNWF